MNRKLVLIIVVLVILAGVGYTVYSYHHAPANMNPTAYITRTGQRYHREWCRSLSQSKIPTSLKDAKARGYTPCRVCEPPR